LAGILSLVLFDVHYQRREIGIRRVYGSFVSEILYRLNKVYLKVLLISFVISIPVSYYFMERWASNFMEKAPVGYLIYFVALLGISILTVGVVTVRANCCRVSILMR
jgi:putative ABC transport system permease protein